MPCVYVFKRGQKAGQQCGKENCKQHAKHIFELQKLPQLVLTNIFKKYLNYPEKYAFNHLLNLSKTCKEFNNIIEPIWELLYDKLIVTDYEEDCMLHLSYLERLHLLLDKGCQKCNRPNIKKIHWPYTIRLCHDCFKEETITPYLLKVRYNIYFITDDEFLLKKDVEEMIECKLEEYHLNDYKRQLATDINLPIKDLSKYSKSYLKKEKPNPIIVIKEYYKNLAYYHFNEHLKSLRLPNKYFAPFSQEMTIIFNIKNKSSYDEWYSNLHTYKERYDENMRIKIYNETYFRKLSHLRFLLSEHEYYNSLRIEEVPVINEIIIKYRDGKVNFITDLETAMLEASDLLKKFIKDNYYKPLFKNSVANEVAISMLRYPSKNITDYDKFIKEFAKKIKYEIPDSLNIKKWKDVVKFVEAHS